MTLSDTGEARVRGYLYVLERSLRSSLPPEVVTDAVREVESHIRERVAETEPLPDERAAVERLLAALGTPTRVARGYSLELSVEEALTTGRVTSTLRAIWLIATMTLTGFFGAIALFTGYVTGVAFLFSALIAAVLPGSVGLILVEGVPTGFGTRTPAPGVEIVAGWWVVPLCLALGLTVLVLTHKGARAWLRWIRTRIKAKEQS
jgi:uncharacterized membrane protein